ncbi:MAG: GGDEF domain-containing protein [Desulfovibrionaceae bacterium]|nr:GGDEF domain-containing protein [Desulfovibrionaceae bacterium]
MKNGSLIIKFSIIFYLFMFLVIFINAFNIFFIQRDTYKQHIESNVKNVSNFLSHIMEAEGENFIYMQDFMLKHIEEFKIPVTFYVDYHKELQEFNKKFVNLYPGKVFNVDISFNDLPYEMQFLFTEFMFKKWLNIFEQAREKFDVKYIYYLVPGPEPLHMYWLIDFHRGVSKFHGPDFINICADVYEPREEHKKMWDAWETNVSPQGYDVYDNKYGKTYAYYTPLFIDNIKCGVIGIEVEIDKIELNILYTSLRYIIYISIVTIIGYLTIMYLIYKDSLIRIKNIHDLIKSYIVNKDVGITKNIENNITGNDEISYLAQSFSTLIYEINNYLNYIKEILLRLYKTKIELDDEHKRAELFEELSKKDALTGVNNKTAYDIAIKKLEEEIFEGIAKFAIAVIDLNSLKHINDTYGHECGNFLIKKLCDLLGIIFVNSEVYRIGGDEFAVILENKDPNDISALLKQFSDEMNKMMFDQNLKPWEIVSAAIGLAYYNSSMDKNVDSVFKRADNEMYMMKKRMKNICKT